MAENYKHLYEQMKKMVEQYQDEIVPGLRKVIAELEQQQAASMWTSAAERVPAAEAKQYFGEYGEYPEYIVMIKGGLVPTTLFFTGEEWIDDMHEDYAVTHWMPMPEQPKDKTDN